MNNLFKVMLGIAVAIVLYYVLQVLIILFALAVCAGAIVLLAHGYKMYRTEQKKA